MIEALLGRFRFLLRLQGFTCSIHTQSLSGKEVLGLMLVTVKKFDGTDMVVVLSLHVLELIHPPLCVALPHLPQGLVLVPALLHILLVDLVHRRLSLEKT